MVHTSEYEIESLFIDRLESCEMTKDVAVEKIFAQFINDYFQRPESERMIFQHGVKE